MATACDHYKDLRRRYTFAATALAIARGASFLSADEKLTQVRMLKERELAALSAVEAHLRVCAPCRRRLSRHFAATQRSERKNSSAG